MKYVKHVKQMLYGRFAALAGIRLQLQPGFGTNRRRQILLGRMSAVAANVLRRSQVYVSVEPALSAATSSDQYFRSDVYCYLAMTF